MGTFTRFGTLVAVWVERHMQRRDLARLLSDPRLMRDLALSPGVILEELRKPFWRS